MTTTETSPGIEKQEVPHVKAETEHKTGPHISIKPEAIFHVNSFPVTNSVIMSGIVLVFFAVLAVWYSRQAVKSKKSSFFYAIHFMLKFLYDLYKSVFGEKAFTYFALLSSFFFFILLNNWSGLLPGVGSVLIRINEGGREVMAPLLRGTTTDLNTTLALAAITVVYVQYLGLRHLGLGYLAKFFDFKSPMKFFVGLMELISEASRVISYSFRLFGNIFAGEVIIAVVAFLVPVLVSFPFLLFEIFVGFIQAIVFTMLSAVFFNLATQEAH